MSDGAPPANVHATAIVIDGRGVLLRGPARSGKSALALSALRRAEGLAIPAALVADDQVFLEVRAGALVAVAPKSIFGLIEVSGAGILTEPAVETAELGLVVDLADPETIPRLPEEASVELLGVPLRRIRLPLREAAYGADVIVSILRPAGGWRR